MQVWNIQLYQSALGETPLETFILSLESQMQNALIRTFDYIQEFGPKIGYPYLKKIPGTAMYELRVATSKTLIIFYVTIIEQTFLILQGFEKQQARLSKKEYTLAKRRLHECGLSLYTN